MRNTSRREQNVLHSLDEIPEFATEDEEDEFWATHSLGPELLDQMGPPPPGLLPPPRPRSTAKPGATDRHRTVG
jgi:hypothetical protein